MRSGIAAILNVVVLVAVVSIMSWPATPALAVAGDETTEDILYLEDGRVLHGHIVTEDRSMVVFEYVDRDLNLRTKLNFRRDEVAKIERDVPFEAAPAPTQPERKKSTTTSSSASGPTGKYTAKERIRVEDREHTETLGVRRGSEDDENLLSVYVVPMEGQMGTDIAPEVYEAMIEDIRAYAPDLLVVQMKCLDSEDRLNSRIDRRNVGQSGINFLDIYREVLNLFQDELRDIPQICWIHDSVGISSVLALSWSHLYMTPDSRLGGLGGVARNFDVADEDVHGKFREAYMAALRGFVEYADYDLDLIDAMVRPELKLSATWEGRTVDWSLSEGGQYVLDGSSDHTVNFRARAAEQFCISDGTAETLDDVALLHGIREFRVLDTNARVIFDDYRDDWRRAYDNCEKSFLDYQQAMGWATGEDTLKYLGKARNLIEKVVSSIDRYKAVELRLAYDYGVRRADLITMIETIREQIRALKRNRGGGGRPPAGGGGGGRGPGSR